MLDRTFPLGGIFPPSSLRSPSISTSSLALTGPLPAASLLHLALSHLRAPPPPLDDDQGFTEEPSLPPEPGPEARVLVLSSDRAAWRDALVKERDVTLFGVEVESDLVGLLDRVEIK